MKPLIAPVRSALKHLGHDIAEARRRRRITLELLARRANTSRQTLAKVEKGDGSVSLATYANVLFVLGLLPHLQRLACLRDDEVGQQLAAEALPKRVRHKKRKES